MTTSPRLAARPEVGDDDPFVEQIMSPHVVAIVPDADPVIASRLMAARRVRHLPILHGGRCQGLVLEIDVLQALALTDNPLVRPPLLVGELGREVPTVHPRDRRSTAARRMRGTGIDAVVVTDGESVVGIVTATDLIRSLAEQTGPVGGPPVTDR